MTNRKDLLKRSAIWGFILLELVFFSVIGDVLSSSDKPFLAVDNMLLVLKQSAPIGIIALGMTIIMINGNIDLSVGGNLCPCGHCPAGKPDMALHAGLGRLGDPAGMAVRAVDGGYHGGD